MPASVMKAENEKVNPFSLLHSSKPRMVVQNRIRHFKTVTELIRQAEVKGYDVSFEHGHSTHEIKLSEGMDDLAPVRSHTIQSARRYLERHPGLI